MINKMLLRLRLQSGYTQEELSELSGISVRTIRNLERGLIQRPRRSSVDMLLAVLDPDLRQELRTQPVDDLGVPTGIAAEWMQLVNPGAGAWRGTRPPRTTMIGRARETELLGQLVTANQVSVITGPGGVGKTRLALAVAEEVGSWFADGVAVAEMGRVPGERYLDDESVMDQAMAQVTELLEREPRPLGRSLLLVLDNTEHLPRTTARLVDRLIAEYPAVHLLITSRRPPKLHGAAIWELPALSAEAAAELLLDRLRTSCPALDLSGEPAQVAELCELLDGLPRLVEFAADRLRMVSLPTLLSDNRARRQLGSPDFSALPHQRTLESSLRWSLDLLDERQQSFLTGLAHRADEAQPDAASDSMELLADLADSSLLRIDRGRRYEYRMLRHVRAFLAEEAPVVQGAA